MADEYIRREDALKGKKTGTFANGICFEAKACVPVDYIESLEPADVVPVVRCKDCEWATKGTELPGWYMCKCEEAFDYYAKPDDFCSYGKRREE